ncbi:hypothetical protein FKM82_031312 [Ascaphus truei]
MLLDCITLLLQCHRRAGQGPCPYAQCYIRDKVTCFPIHRLAAKYVCYVMYFISCLYGTNIAILCGTQSIDYQSVQSCAYSVCNNTYSVSYYSG